MTPEQEKQLALDIYCGQVFTDRHCPADMLTSVFMVFTFMDEKGLEAVKEKVGENGMLYEYYAKAGPRSVNGLPMFMSMNVLSTEEAARVAAMVKSIGEAFRNIPAETAETQGRDT